MTALAAQEGAIVEYELSPAPGGGSERMVDLRELVDASWVTVVGGGNGRRNLKRCKVRLVRFAGQARYQQDLLQMGGKGFEPVTYSV